MTEYSMEDDMSITQQVRQWFESHRDTRIDNAGMRAALDLDDGQQISVALNALNAAGEITREKKNEGHGFEYWLSSPGVKSASAPLSAREIAARLITERPGATPQAAKKLARVAKKTAAKKKAGKKRKYTRRAAPHHLSPLPDPLQRVEREKSGRGAPADAQRASDFAINEDGDLGISAGGTRIALARPEVQRLQGFLKTTAPLWQ